MAEAFIESSRPQGEESPVVRFNDRIIDVFQENRFSIFCEFCFEHNLSEMHQLIGLSFEELYDVHGLGVRKINDIMGKCRDYFTEYGPDKDGRWPSERYRIQDHTIPKIFSKKHFNLFRRYCEAHGINSMRQLLGFDFGRLYGQRVMGATKIQDVIMACRRYFGDLGPDCKGRWPMPIDSYDVGERADYDDRQMQRFMGEMDDLCQATHPDNREAWLRPLLYASKHRQVLARIMDAMEAAGMHKVQDLHVISRFVKTQNEADGLLDWIRDLVNSKLEFLRNKMNYCFIDCDNGRILEVLTERANNKSIEEIRQVSGLTRDRVYHIIVKAQKKFNYFITKRDLYVMLAFGDERALCGLLHEETIRMVIGEYVQIFNYMLTERKDEIAVWNDVLERFIIDGAWYKRFMAHLAALPKRFNEEEAQILLGQILEQTTVPLTMEEAHRLLCTIRPKIGIYYSTKERVTLPVMYAQVMEEFFPDGLRIGDPSDLLRFREAFRQIFPDKELPEQDRTIAARIQSFAVLYRRGTYITPTKVNFPQDLLESIQKAIEDSVHDVIYFTELYEWFKDVLETRTDVHNPYYLHGVLKMELADRYIFTRDAVLKKRKTR